MHYYQFNIKDYKAHTDHLSLMEDLAFRRMLDWVYLHEKPLPINPTEIAKRILMPTHSESIEFVLSEFFELIEDGYVNRTATDNIDSFKAKSEKATKSANMRWNKKADANDMRTHSESNANNKPLTTNNKPLTTKQELVVKDTGTKAKRFMTPTLDQIHFYCNERLNNVDANKFIDHYTSNGWLVGKNKMKDWKAAIRTWEKSSFDKPASNKPASRPVSTTRFF
jgi:uncharacterized protein YdaU (DUF1376 family)